MGPITGNDMSYTYLDDYLDDAAPSSKVNNPPQFSYRIHGKRVFDILIVFVSAPIVIPIIFLGWSVMFLSGGSGFFRQVRVGLDGKNFECWKIRTMSHHAEIELLDRMQKDPVLATKWQHTQKLDDDPRVTLFGNILRKTSIDELPQFWSVLRGDMSLIGPRPFTVDQKDIYDADESSQAYYRLRPGISGLWQVRSRNRGCFKDRIVFDAEYESRVSLGQDLRIALMTIRELLRASGR